MAMRQLGPPVPQTAAPHTTGFDSLFHDSMSPRRSLDSSPAPQPKKRRSVSPEPVHLADDSISSSPAPPSSPSQQKLERISSGPLFARLAKPMLQGLGNAQTTALKRPRRLALSAMVPPSDVSPIQCASANPVLMSDSSNDKDDLPPTRRAFSALLPPTGFGTIEQYSDESSFDGPDMSSPAQAYAKRQHVKTIRRCDGTDDFRPLRGVTAMVERDIQESPSSRFMAAGLPGFGDNEAHGKVLPCHRVKEDGLMRINIQTVCFLPIFPSDF
jgi:M-phase inducer tyrosine phosphatase